MYKRNNNCNSNTIQYQYNTIQYKIGKTNE